MAPSTLQRIGGALLLITLAALPVGCRARALVPNEADAFRDQIRELNGRIGELERTNAELRAQIAAMAPVEGPSAEVLAQVPRIVRLKTGWGSGVERSAEDPDRARLTIYVEPLDGRDRFVQAVGRLEVSVFSLPRPPGEPVRLGGVALDPAELRDRYRAGFGAPRYAIECPLDLAAAAGADSAIVRILFHDALTGAAVGTNMTISLRAPQRAATTPDVL